MANKDVVEIKLRENFIDRVASWVAPNWHLSRVKARYSAEGYKRAFEAIKTDRFRKRRGDHLSGDRQTGLPSIELRRVARDLEQNHDVAKGILKTIEDNVIGTGLRCSPRIRNMNGDLLDDLNDQILKLWDDWCKVPEVTGTFHWGGLQRLVCKNWFRDGEGFGQHLLGTVRNLDHGSIVPYSIEMLEPELIPNALHNPAKNVFYGVQKNEWGRPTFYHVLKSHPGGDMMVTPGSSQFIFASIDQTKKVNANRMTHLYIPERYRQTRGVSEFAAVYTRLDDLRDFEESERIAARIAAAQVIAIKKSNLGLEKNSETGERELPISSGAVWDNLSEGEEPMILSSDRPNNELERFRRSQLKSVSAGTGTNYATVAREYEGSFSSMRQSLLDAWKSYLPTRNFFAARFNQPVYTNFVRATFVSQALKNLPADIDQTTLFDCTWTGDPMPWVDPQKEWKGVETSLMIMARSPQDVIRERGGDPNKTLEEIGKWQETIKEKGIDDPMQQQNANGQSEPEVFEDEEGRGWIHTSDGWVRHGT